MLLTGLRSLGLRQSAPINIHPDFIGMLHRILNVGVPDSFFPHTHTKEKGGLATQDYLTYLFSFHHLL